MENPPATLIKGLSNCPAEKESSRQVCGGRIAKKVMSSNVDRSRKESIAYKSRVVTGTLSTGGVELTETSRLKNFGKGSEQVLTNTNKSRG